jgi:hypothetical protein
MFARNFNELEGAGRLAQNNFGASLGGPLAGGKTVLLRELRGSAQSESHGQRGRPYRDGDRN